MLTAHDSRMYFNWNVILNLTLNRGVYNKNMARRILFIGDIVEVHLANGQEPFRGIILEVNKEVSVDVWYKVKPIGKGGSIGQNILA